jgi:hypothetical protein
MTVGGSAYANEIVVKGEVEGFKCSVISQKINAVKQMSGATIYFF